MVAGQAKSRHLSSAKHLSRVDRQLLGFTLSDKSCFFNQAPARLDQQRIPPLRQAGPLADIFYEDRYPKY